MWPSPHPDGQIFATRGRQAQTLLLFVLRLVLLAKNVPFGKKEQISAYAHCFVRSFNWETSVQIGGLFSERKAGKESWLPRAFCKQGELLAEAFRRSCTLASIVDLKSVQNSFEHEKKNNNLSPQL